MSPRKDNLYAKVLLACALAPVDEMGYFGASDVREPLSEMMGKQYEIASFVRHLSDSATVRGGQCSSARAQGSPLL